MVKLQKLILKNFLSFKEATIPLENAGLCLIAGQNLDANDSNGAGKSTIPSAICWVLFGKTIKGLTGDSVINWDVGKNCAVRLDLLVDDRSISIVRYRNWNDSGNFIKVKIDGEVHTGKLTEIQGMINEIVGFDYETFINTTVYSQDTAKFLGSATDAKRRDIFSTLLNLDRFSRGYESVQLRYRELFTENQNLVDKGLSLAERHTVCEKDRDFDISQRDTYEEEKAEKTRKLRDSIETIGPKEKVKSIRRAISDQSSAMGGEAIRSLEEEEKEIIGEYHTIKRIILDLERKEIKDSCPTCNRKFDSGKIEELRSHRLDELTENQEKMKLLIMTLEKVKGKLDDKAKSREQLAELTRDLEDRERKNEKRSWQLSSFTQQLNDLMAEQNPFHESVERSNERILELEREMGKVSLKLEESNKELSKFKILAELFGKKGIPSYIMENSFDLIEGKANQYLHILSGGKFRIALEPERELTSGEKKEEITLRVFYEDRETSYNNCSDGERQRLNTALLFAINAYCRSMLKVDFLLLDEVLDLSLDETGQEKLMELLNHISGEIGSIFVISHKQNIKDQFDSVLNVVHENGESKMTSFRGPQ